MWIPLALIVFLLTVTAFIAHWSDNYGKKLGKKRVSVFGLRPRHSATLLTVGSSWGIMIVTLTALLVTVAPLRRALFHYEETKKNLSDTQKNLGIYQERLSISQDRFKESQAQGKEADEEKRDAQAKAQNANRAAKAALAQQQSAVAKLETARRKLSTSQGQLASKQAQLALVRAKVVRAQSDVSRAEGDVLKAQDALRNKQQQLAQTTGQLVQTTNRLATNKRLLIESGKQRVALLSQNVSLGFTNENIKAENARIRTENQKIGQLAAIRKAQVEDLSVAVLNDIKLPVDQTLAERRIDAGQSLFQVGRELQTLLDDSRTAVRTFIPGAKLDASMNVPDATNEKSVQLDETQTMQLCAQLLVKSRQSVSARIVPIANYPAGSTEVLGRFVFVPVRTIYIARENIATSTIDTTKSESSIFGQLQKLVEDARYNAVKNGASPPLSPASQNFFDGDTGQKLFDTLRQVEKIPHPVEVHVVAARDLDSAEPLQVRFVVENSVA